MTESHDDPHENTEDDTLDRVLNRGFQAAGDPAKRDGSSPAPSVLQRIGELTGSNPKVALRDSNEPSDTPMLKPLGPEEARDAGKYTIQGELGRGGVGTVHKGHDQELGRDVAMKFLHEKYKDHPDILHRFVEEAQIGGQLQHPGIVPVYDLGMSDGKPFFAMKLVKGKTLAEALTERESVATDRRHFLSIFEQICQTMAYAHARGVVHRDLKPANVMIGSFGEVQVVDWGMGKVLEHGGVADERRAAERQKEFSMIETVRSHGHGTQSIMGSVMGTPAYMPPEQARGDVDTMDARSDVFALGAILCEILTGQPPYVGEQSELIRMAAMAKLDDAHVRLQGCGASDDLIELTTRCLMPASAARPQSAGAVAKGIHEYLAAAERLAHNATVRAAALKRTQKLRIALPVVFAAGIAASLWFWQSAVESTAREQQAAEKERQARALADSRTQEAATARNVAQANLDNFNRLSHVPRLETAKELQRDLHRTWPTNTDEMRWWLERAKDLTEALPGLRETVAALEARAIPLTEGERIEARDTQPRWMEFANLSRKLEVLEHAQKVRSGTTRHEPHELDEDSLSMTYLEISGGNWSVVGPDRAMFGLEALGLARARRAVEIAPEEYRAGDHDTLAWALFANGLDDEALASMAVAIEGLPESRATLSLRKAGLEAQIAAANGPEGERAIANLRHKVNPWMKQVFRGRLENAADDFLYSTLLQLVADIEAFDRREVGAVRQRLTWFEQVENLTITRFDAKWNEARLAILKADGVTASKLYGAVPIELTPQLGLIPIGMNPVTKLWEFYHLRSAWDGTIDPADIAIPTHSEDGSIEVTGETGIVFVLLPGGTYYKSAQETDPTVPNDNVQTIPLLDPGHKVDVAPFLFARHELTQGQWARLWCGEEDQKRPSEYGPEALSVWITEAHPVEQVSWHLSRELCEWHGLTLPSETQWEYGCRGMTTTRYSFDYAQFKDFANVKDAAWTAATGGDAASWSDGYIVHAPVGSLGANPFGLHDVHGNVWEWCLNNGDISSDRTVWGGSHDSHAAGATSASRILNPPTYVDGDLGLRPARTLRLRD